MVLILLKIEGKIKGVAPIAPNSPSAHLFFSVIEGGHNTGTLVKPITH